MLMDKRAFGSGKVTHSVSVSLSLCVRVYVCLCVCAIDELERKN